MMRSDGQAQDPGAMLKMLRRVSWGTSRKEIENLGRRIGTMLPDPSQNRLLIPARFFDLPVGWMFYFRGGLFGSKLIRMDVSFYQQRPSDDVTNRDYIRIHASLSGQLGPAGMQAELDLGDPPEMRVSHRAIWRDGPSVLALTKTLESDGSNSELPPIHVTYADPATDPIGAMLASLLRNQ